MIVLETLADEDNTCLACGSRHKLLVLIIYKTVAQKLYINLCQRCREELNLALTLEETRS